MRRNNKGKEKVGVLNGNESAVEIQPVGSEEPSPSLEVISSSKKEHSWRRWSKLKKGLVSLCVWAGILAGAWAALDVGFYFAGNRQIKGLITDKGIIYDSKVGNKLDPDIFPYNFRMTHPVILPKPENLYRVMALGDSTIFGSNININEPIPFQLEKILNKYYENVEVVNHGCPGTSPANYNKQLEIEHELMDSADYFIIGLCSNDVAEVYVEDNPFIKNKNVMGPSREPRSKMEKHALNTVVYLAERNSFFTWLYNRQLQRLVDQDRLTKEKVLHLPYEQLGKPYYNQLTTLIKKIQYLKKPILVIIGSAQSGIEPNKYDPIWHEDNYRNDSIDICHKSGVPDIDVRTIFQNYLKNNPSIDSITLYAQPTDPVHYSPQSCGWIAEACAQEILKN